MERSHFRNLSTWYHAEIGPGRWRLKPQLWAMLRIAAKPAYTA
jgi:hypothetical protein